MDKQKAIYHIATSPDKFKINSLFIDLLYFIDFCHLICRKDNLMRFICILFEKNYIFSHIYILMTYDKRTVNL